MLENKLKIWTIDRKLIGKRSYTPFLFPFWGAILKESTPYLSAVFRKYNFDKNYYDLVENIEEADFVLMPHNYWFFGKKQPDFLKNCIKECVKEAEAHKKLLLIDAQGDSADHINIKNACILRTSQYRFGLRANEIIIPAYAEDLLEMYFNGRLQIRKKEDLPVAGFADWAELPFLLRAKILAKEIPARFMALFDKKRGVLKKGIFFRQRAINILKESALITANFKIRNFYSGHAKTIHGDFKNVRREFMKNIIDSDYVLCIKGDGNFSTRFYETLSLGRIPLFIDTECVLPLEDTINYKDFCVFVDFRNLSKIDKILADFHKNISDEQFVMMQKKARDAFENYLRIDKFTKYLIGKLKKIAEDHVRDKRI